MRRLIAIAALGVVLAAGGRVARACGGFFCNQPAPNAPRLPIAQAGENVVFVLDRDPVSGAGLVEAHVQIVYTGDVDKFSWIVPVSSLPTLAVGNDVLFQIIEPRTRPAFNLKYTVDGSCKDQGGGDSLGCGAAGEASRGGGFPTNGGNGPGSTATVDVAFRGNVGPFESSIVRSDDPTALETWLVDNHYFISAEASELIKAYVASGSYFVALRLQMGRDVTEIQPIVLKMTAEEGCLPLKLTSIASTPDLRVNVWVLGAGRAVPLNYTEIGLNLLKLDWFTGGSNYDKLVGDAANEAGGNAFTVEYAQPAASAVSWFNVPPSAVSQLVGSTTPSAFWYALQSLGLPISGRVLQVLRTFVPEPATLVSQGVTEAQFYGALPMYFQQNPALFGSFDSAAAAAAIDAQVLKPMGEFRPLFDSHKTLTRVATFISPEEMTKDPLFVTNDTLPDVSNVHNATAHLLCGDQDYNTCDAPVRVDVEGQPPGIRFRPPVGTCNSQFGPPAYDRSDVDAKMPAATFGWRRDPTGEGDVVLDQTASIGDVLLAHNRTVGGVDDGGCSCATTARRARHGFPVAVLALGAAVAIARRRRQRRGVNR